MYGVNLFDYAEVTSVQYVLYWILYVTIILTGVLKVLFTKLEFKKGNKLLTVFSLMFSVLSVLLLAMARETYAVSVAFLLFVTKGIVLMK